MPRANASAFAAESPTSSAPIRPGPGRRRDEVDVVERDAGARERLLERAGQVLEVRARRDLGHDAAVERVRLDLRRDRRSRGSRPSPSRTRDGRLVARGLDAEDDHGAAAPLRAASRARRTAAARLSPYGGRQIPSSVTIAVT